MKATTKKRKRISKADKLPIHNLPIELLLKALRTALGFTAWDSIVMQVRIAEGRVA